MTDTNQIQTVKRLTLETPATFQGLLALVGNVPMEVPADAAVVDLGTMFDHEENDDETITCIETLTVTLEWSADA